jgi:hypothetical protein
MLLLLLLLPWMRRRLGEARPGCMCCCLQPLLLEEPLLPELLLLPELPLLLLLLLPWMQ